MDSIHSLYSLVPPSNCPLGSGASKNLWTFWSPRKNGWIAHKICGDFTKQEPNFPLKGVHILQTWRGSHTQCISAPASGTAELHTKRENDARQENATHWCESSSARKGTAQRCANFLSSTAVSLKAGCFDLFALNCTCLPVQECKGIPFINKALDRPFNCTDSGFSPPPPSVSWNHRKNFSALSGCLNHQGPQGVGQPALKYLSPD